MSGPACSHVSLSPTTTSSNLRMVMTDDKQAAYLTRRPRQRMPGTVNNTNDEHKQAAYLVSTQQFLCQNNPRLIKYG
jgi:hypothetical protein